MYKQYPDVVDVKTLQKMLGVSRSTAYHLVHMKLIQCKRVGRKYLVPKSEVERFLLENIFDCKLKVCYNNSTKSVLS